VPPDATPGEQRPLRLSLLTTYAEPCGIATYSEALVEGLSRQGVVVSVVAPRLRPADAPRGPQPARVWRRDRAGWLEAWQTFREVTRQKPDVVHIQHTTGIVSASVLLAVARLCSRAGIPVVATLHEAGGGSWLRRARFARALYALRRATLIVHQADPSLPGATVIPHGVAEVPKRPRDAARAALGIPPNQLVLAHFGFIHPDKGIAEVLRAVAALRGSQFPKLTYRICGGTFTSGRSTAHLAELRALVQELGLADAVSLSGEFLDEDSVTLEMQAADLVVLNYQTGNRQGASGAANRALAVGAAVAVSRAPIFDALRDATHTLSGPLPSELSSLLESPSRRAELSTHAEAFSSERSWSNIAARHVELYRSLINDGGGSR
jgi:glycosyltransferase involved in cell wall biosynthesis